MAVGGAGAFLATLALIVLAMQQMRYTREQADAAESRPRLRPIRSPLCVRRPTRTPSGGTATKEREGKRAAGSATPTSRHARSARSPGRRATPHGRSFSRSCSPTRTARRSPSPTTSSTSARPRRLPVLPDQRGTGLALDIDSGVALGGVENAFAGGMRVPQRVRASPFRPASPVSLTRVDVQFPALRLQAADREHPQTEFAHQLGCLSPTSATTRATGCLPLALGESDGSRARRPVGARLLLFVRMRRCAFGTI
jgi:hypothetical protein